jgi:AcrR family transcriptional regulator
MSERLDRQAWLDAGLILLAQRGVGAVRITDLAKQLNVTKGSFYWHFQNRAELLEAMLDIWETAKTDLVIAKINAIEGDAKAKLRVLFGMSLNSDGEVFLAIHIWASIDNKAANIFERVARRRIAFVEGLFLEMGFDAQEAAARAHFVFQALIGHYALGSAQKIFDSSQYMDIIHNLLTVQPTGS